MVTRQAVKWNSPFYGTVRLKPDTTTEFHEGELDEKQIASWVKQAAALPGWIP